mmetsp:Transcript_30570/g.66168  ORF Transcript_30570/g.66168 Transcript_30570/m.66168 type:complete len:96 (+) Transcript_30570:66-353(+)
MGSSSHEVSLPGRGARAAEWHSYDMLVSATCVCVCVCTCARACTCVRVCAGVLCVVSCQCRMPVSRGSRLQLLLCQCECGLLPSHTISARLVQQL